MASVVFLRAVNVGGHQPFQPRMLVKQLAALDLVNIGAAGTFIVRKRVSQALLRQQIQRRLRFKTEVMIYAGKELLELVRSKPFPDPLPKKSSPFFTALASKPRELPPLPTEQPQGAHWQVRIIAIEKRYALSLWRHQGRTVVYPNAVVEKTLRVRATTRNWNTILTVCKILEE